MSHISNYAIKIVDFPPISFRMCKNRLCIWWWYIYDIPISFQKWLVVDRCTNNFIYFSRIVAPTFKRFHSFPAIQD